MPTATIDGKKVKVRKNVTILDAARKAGLWIPTLCFNPSVSPPAACRLCLVELDRGDWKQLVTACNYPVRGDVTVSVSSERAVRARRGVMELLLARAPDSQELKELALRMGVKGTPYPTVTETQRNCILCGLCTSVCEELIGRSAIGFAGRGAERTVAAPFRQASEDCIACGACAVVCPVGTIQVRLHEDTAEAEISPFKSRAKLLLCEGCGASLVTEPLAGLVLEKIRINRDQFLQRSRLCPKCRRKKTAEVLTLTENNRQE